MAFNKLGLLAVKSFYTTKNVITVFDNIEYLRRGNSRQQQAYSCLSDNQVLLKLKLYTPILVGTVPINVNIENSDLDIICCFYNTREFIKTITDNFRDEKNFTIKEQQNPDSPTVIASFILGDFEIEIFGQKIPTKQQFAYRHMIVEHNLLKEYGEKLRQQVVGLKRQGHKTEPAFGLALGLTGDPYMELLKFEINDTSEPLTKDTQ